MAARSAPTSICDRTGILARTIADAAKVLDALKDSEAGYYDPRDPYTTVPRSSVLATPYASHAKALDSLRARQEINAQFGG